MSELSLLQLPTDILVNILKKLQISDLFNVILTCKTLKELVISENTIWRHVCKDRLILRNVADKSQIQLSWRDCCRISNNWCKGIFRNQGIVHHRINYMPWLNFHNSEVLVLSVGSNLRCYPTNQKGFPNGKEVRWQIDVPKVQRNDIRTNDISRFIIRDNLLVCGNRDGSVAVYEWSDLKNKPYLTCHIEDCHENGMVEVSAVELIKNNNFILVTGSNDSQHLNFWQWQTDYGEVVNGDVDVANNVMDISICDSGGVRCLAVNEAKDRLGLGLNGNSKPFLLDINMGEFLMTAESTKDVKQVTRDIRWHDANTLLSVTHSGVLQLVDVRSHEVTYNVKDPFHSTLYCVKSDGKHAVVAGSSEYSRCVLFDVRNSSKHTQMYFTNQRPSPVYSLDFDATKLIIAVDRGVSVLNFNVSSAIPKKDYSDAFHT